MGWLTTGAETTAPSSTNAACLPTLAVVYSPHADAPAGLNVRLMTQPTPCWAGTAWAVSISVPSMMTGSRTYFSVPLSLQATSGSVGSS